MSDAIIHDAAIQDEIRACVEGLSAEKRRQVLEYARSLARPKAATVRDLRKFVGVISREDLERMSQAIEEGCERIDADGW